MKKFRVAIFILSLTALGVGPATAQTGHDLFQQALLKERAEGELGEAIQIYERIVRDFAADRTLTASALVQMGQCYEKLGSTEAERAYQTVVRDFADQPDLVAQAEARLAALMAMQATARATEIDRQPTFRKIEIASRPQNGVLSPDGTQLAFVADGSVWMVPLHGNVNPDIAGEPVRLTDDIGAWDVSNLLSWSANGEWIAVNSDVVGAGGEESFDGIGVVHVGGRDTKVFPVPTTRWGPASMMRVSISPDGTTLAYAGLDPDGPEPDSLPGSVWSRYIIAVQVSGGLPQKMTHHWSSQPAFSPDGRYLAYVGPTANQEPIDDESAKTDRLTVDDLQRARALWIVPSEGGEPVRLASVTGKLSGPVWSLDGNLIAALWGNQRDSSRGQIWVFPVAPDRNEVGEPVRIDLPREALDALPGWTPEGDLGVFIPTESWAAVYTVSAAGGKAVQVSPEGWPFHPRWSPDGDRIYARWSDETNSAHPWWIASVPSGGGEVEAIPLRWDWEIIPRLPGGGIHVSPNGETVVFAGYERREGENFTVQLWTIPVGGGRPTQLTHGRGGVTNPCWSPDGSFIAFLRPVEGPDGEDYPAIHLIPAEGGEAHAITGEPGEVERGDIAFSPDGQRIAFFSGDAIKVTSVGGGEIRALVHIDGFDDDSELAWSPSGEAIAYSHGGRIWVAPLDGGRPQQLVTGLSEDIGLRDVSWSPDGQKIAFIGKTGGGVELWLISDFLR